MDLGILNKGFADFIYVSVLCILVLLILIFLELKKINKK